MAKSLSTFTAAKMLHVDPGSVANWIDKGQLKAFRTPGGHRRIQKHDLLEFLRKLQMPIPPELQPKTKQVLIVDDEREVANMLARAVSDTMPDWQVDRAYSGFEAGAAIATLRPDVVVLDIRMPGMDGFEVCRQIKADPKTSHCQVLAMTAYPSEETENRILDYGARRCLAKPLDIEEFLREVQDAVEDT